MSAKAIKISAEEQKNLDGGGLCIHPCSASRNRRRRSRTHEGRMGGGSSTQKSRSNERKMANGGR